MRRALAVSTLLVLGSGCHGTDDAHCFLSDVDPEMVVTQVEVETLTGTRGTDSDIYLLIDLEEGATQSLYLDNSADTFEAGADEVFDVPVTPFLAGNVASLSIRKDSSLFESGDWDLDGLTVTFQDEDGGSAVVYDNPRHVERLTGDETQDLRCL